MAFDPQKIGVLEIRFCFHGYYHEMALWLWLVIKSIQIYVRHTNIRYFLVFHKCSSVSPCHNGGVCEAVDWIYQCHCTGTAHHGSLCQKGRIVHLIATMRDFFRAIYYSFVTRCWISLPAGNPWTAPNGWDTPHPQIYLNLDDQRPYFVYNGASYVTTEVSEKLTIVLLMHYCADDVFSWVCLSFYLSTGYHVIIADDALYFTVQVQPNDTPHPTSPHPRTLDMALPSSICRLPASDIWWSWLETCSNIFIGPIYKLYLGATSGSWF